MDFVEGLPNSEGKEIILVIVDRFTKYAHFIPLSCPLTAPKWQSLFYLTFINYMEFLVLLLQTETESSPAIFQQHMFKALGVTLKLSTTYHPQTDEQTKRVNQCLECYLRCMMGTQPKKWVAWLPLAEWWYNPNYQTTLGKTPYQALYGVPLTYYGFDQVNTPNEEVAKPLKDHCTAIGFLKDRLRKAQSRVGTTHTKTKRKGGSRLDIKFI